MNISSFLYFKFIDECFQNESSAVKDLELLQTHLKINFHKDITLQVSFPPLNKALPSDLSTNIQMVESKESTGSSMAEYKLLPSGSQGPEESILSKDEASTTNSTEMSSITSSCDAVNWKSMAEKFCEVLEEAVSIRVLSSPDLQSCKSHSSGCVSSDSTSCATLQTYPGADFVHGIAKVGLLFSGGVDSVVLAALVDRLG